MAASPVEFYTPKIEQTSKGTVYSSNNLGGYSFVVPKGWNNVNNQSAQGKLNITVFLRDSDNTQSLTLSLALTPDSEKGKSIDIRNRIEKSLTKKGIKYNVVGAQSYSFGDKNVEDVDVEMDNNRMMYAVGMYCGNLTFIGNLGYIKDDPSIKKDVLTIFETFKSMP